MRDLRQSAQFAKLATKYKILSTYWKKVVTRLALAKITKVYFRQDEVEGTKVYFIINCNLADAKYFSVTITLQFGTAELNEFNNVVNNGGGGNGGGGDGGDGKTCTVYALLFSNVF